MSIEFKTDADEKIFNLIKDLSNDGIIEKVTIDNKYNSFIAVSFYITNKDLCK